MRNQKFLAKISALVLAAFAMLFSMQPAHAMNQLSIDNVQAGVRTLNFLGSLPKAMLHFMRTLNAA